MRVMHSRAPARMRGHGLLVVVVVLGIALPALAEKRVWWGDTHLHTNYSFDAYLNRNMTADPDTAYRYAKGLPVVHPFHRARVQIDTPLDFLVVSDHAEYLGVIRHVVDEGIPRDGLGLIDRIRARMTERFFRDVAENDSGMSTFQSLLPVSQDPRVAAATPPAARIPNARRMSQAAWEDIIAAADEHDLPGTFTALIGWEWSSLPGGANLHRIVVTDADSVRASAFLPFSSADSQYPEDLWAWLDRTSQRVGATFVSIPHNSNLSKGFMFPTETLRGEPIDADYARTRMRWEPIVEATQIKGDSEAHPALSPNDEFASFEIYPHYIQQDRSEPYRAHAGDYVRSALRRGLEIERSVGTNPYQFGLIGSTDAHTGLPSAEETNFQGKLARDSIPEAKQTVWSGTEGGANGWSMSASGLAAVWASENTREEIVAAFRRREVYATTGPRIGVRLAAGWGEGDEVPMGGVLPVRTSGVPTLRIEALKDPKGANLDRIQVVKGWVDEHGASHERVFDAAWSGERRPDADGRLPRVGDTVDRTRATYTNTIGSAGLDATWRDPDFDDSQSAFYYVRVLEIPTPRHALLDALALGLEAPTRGPSTLQERAYTSPVWYRPAP